MPSRAALFAPTQLPVASFNTSAQPAHRNRCTALLHGDAYRSGRRSLVMAALVAVLPALPAFAQGPIVVTDIPPVHALVAQVMGDLGTPVLLLERGADEHDFQLRPSQMQSIADAGLIIWIGPELTPWLDRATLGATVPMLALLDAPGTLTQPFGATGEPDPEHDHTDEQAPEATAKDDHDHDHGTTDPHVWLNPQNAALWLPMIAADLARVDPDNAAIYAANATAAADQITALDAEIAATLAPIASRPFVTYHNAYGYFAAHYGLNYAGALANGEAAEPGAAHLVALQALLSEKSVRCVFPEAQHDPALAARLIEGTPAVMGDALDPVGSTLDAGPDAYANLLRGLAATLVTCLKG